MEKAIQIFDKLLIYKNYRIFIVLLYSILIIYMFNNWDLLMEFWFEIAKVIYQRIDEPFCYLIIFYHFIFSFYAILGLFFPLNALGKRYNRNHKLKIKRLRLDRENLIIASESILLTIFFPFVCILCFIVWMMFSYSIMAISAFFLLVFLIFAMFLTTYVFYRIIDRVLKKILRL